MDTFSSINPLGIDLVLDMLFDLLEPKYLRKCRLVSHQWNSLIVNKMRTRSDPEYTIPLDSSNFLEYSATIRHSALPSESLMPVSLNIQAKRDEQGTALDKFIITELVESLGPQFVQHLTCTSAKTGDDWDIVFELVRLLSPGLKTLWISEGPFKQSITQVQIKSDNFYLPLLTSITYFEILKNPTLLVTLVNSTVQLKELILMINSMESIKGESYRNRSAVISKVLNQIESSKLQQLKRFVIPLDQQATYHALCQIRFPKLTQLKLSLKRNACDTSAKILSQFLSSNCPKLTSLEFSFLVCSRELEYPVLGFPNGNAFSEFPKYLPHLPNLTHFGYAYDEFPASTSTPAFIRANHLNAACFPNVTSIIISYGTFLYSSAGFDDPDLDLELVDWYNNPSLINNLSFPSVSKLTLVLNSSIRFGINFKTPKLTLEEACNQLHLLFPNVDELCVDVHFVPLSTESCYQRANEFLARLLEEIAPLKKLELANFFHSQRQTVQFLKDNPAATSSLQSLEEIRFIHNSKSSASMTGKRTKPCLAIRPVQKKGTPIVHEGFQLNEGEPPSSIDVNRKTVLDTLNNLVNLLPQLRFLKVDGTCLTNHCPESYNAEMIVNRLQTIFNKLNIQLS